MSISTSTIIWYDAKVMSPVKAGLYLVNTFGDHYTDLTFTPEGGWNTHRDADGFIDLDNAMDVTAWAELPTKEAVFA